MNIVNGFVVDRSAGARIPGTRAFVALAAEPLVEPQDNSPSSPSSQPSNNQPSSGLPKIESLKGEDAFRNFLNQDDRLTMVKFYSPRCKSCQKFGMQYKRIGKEIGELTSRNSDGTESTVREGEIRMAEMEYGTNKEFCKSLGITKLPSVHFYSNGKLVDGFPCGPKKIGKLLDKLTMYRSMTPTELEFEADMNQGSALGDSVLETLNQGLNIEVTDKPTLNSF
eukprot:CAMPEP_0176019372 /NCGR_PEP_ID=MMETSP0120_2-20121206/9356_1 /TAXON_ID=160619 /ORGANISM="Kryptoperidinium foliaceum, Strain CCMP 1326" /LENGTH=223 /DNA_ID=CAMNT_0017352445 /DNA_START=106 /DNA_END=777 /DNA_ORIENTATION=-